MGNEVFANGNEIACKSGDGKVIATFPDVCLSPPSPPAGPIPVPYPDTSFSKDMKNGSKTVKIDGKEVMLKDKSFYKTSPLGNEAATKSLGAGVVSHVITGKTYFVAWSMDIKFEGKNVDRHIDLTTSNHASPMGNSVPGSETESSRVPVQGKLFCECCWEEVHSNAQAFGDEITEEEFYFPPGLPEKERKLAEETIKMVREGPCKDLMPPKPPGDDPCNKYYPPAEHEKKERPKAREKYSAAGRNPLSDPIGYRPHIYGHGQQGHRVPISAGGCATGERNLHPVSNDCLVEEHFLGVIQENALKKHLFNLK